MARLNDTELHMIKMANQLDAIEPAARAMLAALKAAQEHVGTVLIGRGLDADAARESVAAAIAQAEAAGIKTEE